MRNRPIVDAACSCSYLSDHMSLSAPHHLLRVFCWLARCSRQTSRAAARLKARLMQGGCCGPHRSTSGLLLCTICVHHVQEGADDVTAQLVAALTASAHAIGRGSEGACSGTQAEQRLD